MIYHLLHFFYWKVFKMDKTRNPQSKRPTFIFGNCMYISLSDPGKFHEENKI